MQLVVFRRILPTKTGFIRYFSTKVEKKGKKEQEYHWTESKPAQPDKNVDVHWENYPNPEVPNGDDFSEEIQGILCNGDAEVMFYRARSFSHRDHDAWGIENRSAAALFLEAAKRGHAKSQVEIGKMYLVGYGVTKEHKSAIQFFGRAANQGHPDARAFLGSMYLRGFGIRQNFDEARRLLDESSKLGNSRAKRYLAEMFEKGMGVNKDVHIAMRLAERASEDGELAPDVRGEAYAIAGRGYAHTLDYVKAAQVFQVGSDLNDKDCQANLGHIYDVGVPGIESNVAKSAYLLLKAANQGQTRAHRDLGIIFAYGREDQQFPPDVTEALHWLDLATKGGFLDAYLRLGEMYASGNNRYPGVAQNLQLARKIFELARKESLENDNPRDKLPAGVWRRIINDPLSIRNLIDDYERDGEYEKERVRFWRGSISDLKPNLKPSSR